MLGQIWTLFPSHGLLWPFVNCQACLHGITSENENDTDLIMLHRPHKLEVFLLYAL